MEEEREHKRFSPSRSEQFILCRGSGNLLGRVPPTLDDQYTIEGNKAHRVLEAGLRAKAQNAQEAISASPYAQEKFSADFRSAINTALDYVWNTIDTIDLIYGDAVLFIETEVNPPIDSAPGEAGGFCDIAIHSAKGRLLYVVDYKHGVGISKAVQGNTQVKQYAAGFLFDERKFVDSNNIDVVTLVIIQPRSFHPDGDIREYNTTVFEIYDYLIYLDGVIEEALKPDAPLTPGETQCRFCAARFSCPALALKSIQVLNPHATAVEQVSRSKLPEPSSLDLQRLSYIKQMKPLVMQWFKGVEDAVETMMLSGVAVPGLKIVEAKPVRRWYGPEKDRILKLASVIGVSDFDLYDVVPKVLTDVEAMMIDAFKSRVGKGNKRRAAEDARQYFAYFTDKASSGKLTVVEESDPRPAFDRALKAFGHIQPVLQPPTT